MAQLPPPFGFRSSVRRASKLAELGTQQVIEHEGVVVANPVHVVTRTGLLRRFIIQTSSLRIADKERDSKAAALYAHTTSDRFWQLQSQDNDARELLDIDVAEQKAHATVWKGRRRVIQSMQTRLTARPSSATTH